MVLLDYPINFFLKIFESGCQGLLTAAVLERMVVKQDTQLDGKIYKYFQPGSQSALDALNMSREEQKKYVRSNLFPPIYS